MSAKTIKVQEVLTALEFVVKLVKAWKAAGIEEITPEALEALRVDPFKVAKAIKR